MKKKHAAPKKGEEKLAPVAGVVHTIYATAKSVHEAKAAPRTDRHAADMSSALSAAATVLAAMDAPPAPEPKGTPLQRVLKSIGLTSAKAKPAKRSGWGAAAPKLHALDAKRIEDVLQTAIKAAPAMSLDDIARAGLAPVNEAADCVMPPDAVDPVCEPR